MANVIPIRQDIATAPKKRKTRGWFSLEIDLKIVAIMMVPTAFPWSGFTAILLWITATRIGRKTDEISTGGV